jgi:hypothetical protein
MKRSFGAAWLVVILIVCCLPAQTITEQTPLPQLGKSSVKEVIALEMSLLLRQVSRSRCTYPGCSLLYKLGVQRIASIETLLRKELSQ